MKSFYFLLLVFSFFITGCFSTNYTINDFDSKKDFYKDFNDFANNKEIDLIFKSGSTLTTEESPKISDGFLILKTQSELTGKNNLLPTDKILLNKVDEANYKNRWLGSLAGFGLGFAVFSALGVTKVISFHGGGMSSDAGANGIGPLLAVSSLIIGPIVGWIIGINTSYRF